MDDGSDTSDANEADRMDAGEIIPAASAAGVLLPPRTERPDPMPWLVLMQSTMAVWHGAQGPADDDDVVHRI